MPSVSTVHSTKVTTALPPRAEPLTASQIGQCHR